MRWVVASVLLAILRHHTLSYRHDLPVLGDGPSVQIVIVCEGVLILLQTVPLHPNPQSLALIPPVEMLDPAESHVRPRADSRACPKLAVNNPSGPRDPVHLVSTLLCLNPLECRLVCGGIVAPDPAGPRSQCGASADSQDVVRPRVLAVVAQEPREIVHGWLGRGEIASASTAWNDDNVQLRCGVEGMRGKNVLCEEWRGRAAAVAVGYPINDGPVNADRLQIMRNHGQCHVVLKRKHVQGIHRAEKIQRGEGREQNCAHA